MAKPTIGVILSGAGDLDGADIQEAVLVLLSLAQQGATAKVFAPDIAFKEIDGFDGQARCAVHGCAAYSMPSKR